MIPSLRYPRFLSSRGHPWRFRDRSQLAVHRAVPPLRTPARLLTFKPAAQSETTSPVVDPQGVTYAADRFGARRGRGLNRSRIRT